MIAATLEFMNSVQIHQSHLENYTGNCATPWWWFSSPDLPTSLAERACPQGADQHSASLPTSLCAPAMSTPCCSLRRFSRLPSTPAWSTRRQQHKDMGAIQYSVCPQKDCVGLMTIGSKTPAWAPLQLDAPATGSESRYLSPHSTIPLTGEAYRASKIDLWQTPMPAHFQLRKFVNQKTKFRLFLITIKGKNFN